MFQKFSYYFLSLAQRSLMYSAHKGNTHQVYRVAELSHLSVLARQHANDSKHHPPSLFSLSSQLYMQEVSHMPANTFNSGTSFCAHETWFILWHVYRKPELWCWQSQPLLGNNSTNTPISRQWLSSRHVAAATNMHATTWRLLKAMFSVWSMLRPYIKDQLPVQVESWDSS
jgi:hypothetical protein